MTHDLESIFYVFIFLCTNLSGAKVPCPLPELRELKSLPMASWFNPASSTERLGAAWDKMASMMLFEQCILPYFAKYFVDLILCARQLRNAIYPEPTSLVEPIDISHDGIIRIFDEALDTLPSVSSVPMASSGPPDQANQTNQVGLKRQFGTHDNLLNSNRLSKRKNGSWVNHSSSGIHSSTGSRSLKASSSRISSTSWQPLYHRTIDSPVFLWCKKKWSSTIVLYSGSVIFFTHSVVPGHSLAIWMKNFNSAKWAIRKTRQ